MLQRYAEETDCAVHLDPYDSHGGDPAIIIEKSIKESNNRILKRGMYDGGRFVLLDSDRIGPEAVAKALRAGIHLVQQVDCLETHLGKILSGRLNSTPAQAKRELLKTWPDYRKGFDSASLKSRMTLDLIRGSGGISAEWEVFLQTIGLIKRK
ncbi:hypothetical protein [Methylobacterium pseudosasicola]|uniref:hypothetical protein n=1 Tax=Methylobacterium pseudosasicola TaxID=582667 RepID=UPI0011140114|nr:hypothetical protein [Methylobacterium pseudosasicola]